jgi:hypothetical protein
VGLSLSRSHSRAWAPLVASATRYPSSSSASASDPRKSSSSSTTTRSSLTCGGLYIALRVASVERQFDDELAPHAGFAPPRQCSAVGFDDVAGPSHSAALGSGRASWLYCRASVKCTDAHWATFSAPAITLPIGDVCAANCHARSKSDRRIRARPRRQIRHARCFA